VPLSVDLESGYSANPDAVAQLIVSVTGAGAAGINLEDGVAAPELLAAKISAATPLP
jgi:2-methylisocitrate lyase-like PEP mutase family enzyme